MNRIIITVCLLATGFTVSAQGGQEVELIDLIKIFIPDNSRQSGLADWTTGAEMESPVMWETNGLDSKEDYFFRRGRAVVTLNGEYLKCLARNIEPCKWYITMKGPRIGYFSVEIRSVLHQEIYPDFAVRELIESEKHKATLIKACEKYASNGSYTYRMEIPGKKPFILEYFWSCGSAGCSITLVCHLSGYKINHDCP